MPLGSRLSIVINFIELTKVSSAMINSHSCSRKKRSSPILTRSVLAQISSRSGCELQMNLILAKPLRPSFVGLPYSSTFFVASFQMRANWSSSWLGVLVIIHLPPVDSVGDIDVQNSDAIRGLTNANSSK